MSVRMFRTFNCGTDAFSPVMNSSDQSRSDITMQTGKHPWENIISGVS